MDFKSRSESRKSSGNAPCQASVSGSPAFFLLFLLALLFTGTLNCPSLADSLDSAAGTQNASSVQAQSRFSQNKDADAAALPGEEGGAEVNDLQKTAHGASGAETESNLKSAKAAERQDSAKEAQFEALIQMFLPPVLERSKPFWGSIYDLRGQQLPPHKVTINERVYKTDDFACLRATAPDDDQVKLEVFSEDGRKLWQSIYYSSPSGLLVADKSVLDLVDRLDRLCSSQGEEPIITHAPSLVQPMQALVVLGRNFTGRQGDVELEIDGRESDLLAASTRSIVAVSNRNLKLGAVKVLRVSVKSLSSLPVETDVASAEIKASVSGSAPNKHRLQIIGSNLPALVSLSNSSAMDLRFGGWRLGQENVFLSPGGQQNWLILDGDAETARRSLSASLISNGLFDPYSLKSSRTLLNPAVAAAEEAAEFVRLKKREIALEARKAAMERERSKLNKDSSASLEDEERLDAGGNAIAARLYRVGRMLQCRRTAIESFGQADIGRLLDTASGKGIYILDQAIASQDLGFTEARLLKVVGRRQAKERELERMRSTHAYLPQYYAPPAAVLDNYRKKYGKRGTVPPPPQAPVLIPPPPPFRPDPGDIGPYLPEMPPVLNATAGQVHKSPAYAAGSGKTGTGRKPRTPASKSGRNVQLNAKSTKGNLPRPQVNPPRPVLPKAHLHSAKSASAVKTGSKSSSSMNGK